MKLRQLITELQNAKDIHGEDVDVEILMCGEHHDIYRVFVNIKGPLDTWVTLATEDEE